ncbi:hypothetical protein J3R82DRAFT_8691 [Butyriboletus roseoflavus]|nr:hypothetical protein J3R82DRAFT_8691 [Butyriboletus roseoflavus]
MSSLVSTLSVLLCGIKALQLLNIQTLKKPCTHWSLEETHLMFDLLIAQSSKIGQLASFPQPVYAEVAKSLGANKTDSMVSSKFQIFKDLIPFHNRRWPFLEKMVKLCPSGTIATGIYSLALMEAMFVDQVVNDLNDNALEYEPSGILENDLEFPSDIDMDSLLQLEHDLGSSNPFIQFFVLDSMILMYSQVSPTAFNNLRSLYNQRISSSPTLPSFLSSIF